MKKLDFQVIVKGMISSLREKKRIYVKNGFGSGDKHYQSGCHNSDVFFLVLVYTLSYISFFIPRLT